MNSTSWERGDVKTVNHWALDVSPGHEGALLYNTPWNPTEPYMTMHLRAYGSQEVGVFVRYTQTLRRYFGFSIATGKFLWEAERQHPMDYYDPRAIYDGKLYDMGYGGILFCYDLETGQTLWKTEIPDEYNEVLWSNNWGTYSQLFIADGKVYVGHNEHSPIDPKPRGAPFTCIDAETGEILFRMNSIYQSYTSTSFLIGDSIVALHCTYDMHVYAFGKGPSATTVTAGPKVSQLGNPVLIEGTVMDVSPGTNAPNRVMRFPNGVPAAADEGMSEWMQYVYQQFPKPANAAGVEVVIYVLDANGNYYEVGRTTTDASGGFKLSFEPLVPGDYTVIACFEGSKSYWPSNANTYMSVTEAPAASPAPTPVPQAPVETYFTASTIAIIVAIAIIGFLILRKR
jgi:hypothetical protein